MHGYWITIQIINLLQRATVRLIISNQLQLYLSRIRKEREREEWLYIWSELTIHDKISGTDVDQLSADSNEKSFLETGSLIKLKVKTMSKIQK